MSWARGGPKEPRLIDAERGRSGKGRLTRGNSLERMTGIEPALSAWEAGESTRQVVFQAQTWPFEGPFRGFFRRVGARGGPEQLINMATGRSEAILPHCW